MGARNILKTYDCMVTQIDSGSNGVYVYNKRGEGNIP